MHRPACENPAHVGPEATVARRVWITFFVCVLVMHAVSGNPKYGTALEAYPMHAAHFSSIAANLLALFLFISPC